MPCTKTDPETFAFRFSGLFGSAQIDITQPLYTFGKISHARSAARAGLDAQRALEVLDRERPNLTTALTKLGTFSDTANRLVNDSQADLVRNLQNLEPTIRALADVGPDISTALAFATVFPLGQNLIDRGIRGDYMNLFVTIDLTGRSLKERS